MAITHGDIGGAEPSTITFKVDTVTLDLNSTTVHREVLVIGDPQTSNAIARVVAAPPVSTEFAQIVRIASGPSSAADLQMRPVFSSTHTDNPVRAVLSSTSGDNLVRPIFSSTNTDNPVRAVLSSTAADNPVSISGNSTVVQGTNPWTIAGNSTVVQGTSPWLVAITGPVSSAAPAAGDSGVVVRVVGYSTIVSVAAFPANSSQVEVRALPANSSQVEVRNSPTVVIGTNLQSTVAPSSGSSGLVVRQVYDVILTTASSNAFGTSTSLTLASSVAGIRNYVTAYSITCTNAVATKLAFYSGSSMNWPIVLQAVSSAIAGANLSASPYLFRTNAAEPFTLQMGGSSVAGFKVAVSYYKAP